ncbi:MAG: hypothetical protein ACFFCI_00920 [Promethearchaeota archaeon]
MTQFNLDNMRYFEHWIDGRQELLGDPSEFFIDSFSLPQDQELPEDYVEFLDGILIGPMGSGKTYTMDNDLARIGRYIWPYKIDFIKSGSISGTIEAILKSDKPIKFVKFDDIVKGGILDSRTFNRSGQISETEKFFTIRHLAQKGILKAGYIILFLATQDFWAVEKRVRNQYGILIFKGYIDGCEEFVKNDEALKTLLELADNARRRHRHDIRKQGIMLDVQKNCYKIITEKVELCPHCNRLMHWIKLSRLNAETLNKKNKIEYEAITRLKHTIAIKLNRKRSIPYTSFLSGFLNQPEEKLKGVFFCSNSQCNHIMKDIPIPWIPAGDGKEAFREQYRTLIDTAIKELKNYNHDIAHLEGKFEGLTIGDLKGALEPTLRSMEEELGDACEVMDSHLTPVIRRARYEFKKWKIEKALASQGIHEDKDRKGGIQGIREIINDIELDKPKTGLQEICLYMLDKKITTLEELKENVHSSLARIRVLLSNNKHLFENVVPGKALWCIQGYIPSQSEIESKIGVIVQKEMTKLKMGSE